MDAQTRSRARLSLHAIERQSQLLVEALDASMVEVSAECTRWGAVSDPRRWLTPSLAPHGKERAAMQRQLQEAATKFAQVTEDVERFIRAGAAGHECEAKCSLREDLVYAMHELAYCLRSWMAQAENSGEKRPRDGGPFPQYVPRFVQRASGEIAQTGAHTMGVSVRTDGGAR